MSRHNWATTDPGAGPDRPPTDRPSPTREHPMELTGAQALIKSLEMQQVEVMFGLPGGAILPVYDPIIDSSIRHILVRHEQGAGHMAEGYAQVTGRPGVAMVTSGPGATNVVTPLADAYMDSIPLVAVTGQVATTSIGTDAFQESDITGITMGITKHNWLITDGADIPRVVAEAFHVATTGRPGPVLIDIPKDVAIKPMEWYWPEPSDLDLPGYHPVTEGDPALVREAAELLLAAELPVIYAGGGILKARAAEALRELAERTGIPVVTTLMARGCFPDSHPLCLGMPGMHGNYTAVTAMQRSDLLIALGSRFDDRVTGRVDAFAPEAKVIHVDIDPAEHNKVRRADVAIAGDCRLVIDELLFALDALGLPHSEATRGGSGGAPSDAVPGAPAAAGSVAASFPRQRLVPWRAQLSEWQQRFPLVYDQQPGSGALKPQFVLERLRDATPDDTIVVSGVGQHQMFASQWWRFDHPYTWVNSGGLGTMGYAVPAAIGAKVGRPDRTVWAVDGDGCFQMTAQELVTASSERIPIKVAILNNAYLGMVRQWQEMFYGERYSEVYLSPDLPDYVGWAESMGCVGMRVDSTEEVDSAIDKANDIDDRPVVIDFRTDAFEKVFPMVAAGASNDDIIVDPSQTGGDR
ncbi:MAG: thiamine pyrophosphate-dependent enzyme [Acidimicrobiales bacterium]